MAEADAKSEKAKKPVPIGRRIAGEVVGTFVLTFVAAGADVVESTSLGSIGHVARYLAPGIAVMAMIWSLSGISGAHINPAVTVAFFLRRCFSGRLVGIYVGSQLGGAILAGVVLRAMFGPALQAGITHPTMTFDAAVGFAAEVILTCILVLVILGTADQKPIVGQNAALAVGGIVAMCGLAFSPLSGASMNPARSLGPMVALLNFQWAPLYIIAPLAGAALAATIAWALYGPPSGDETRAAQGA